MQNPKRETRTVNGIRLMRVGGSLYSEDGKPVIMTGVCICKNPEKVYFWYGRTGEDGYVCKACRSRLS